MSELSCDTPFIGQIETHDLIRNQHPKHPKRAPRQPQKGGRTSHTRLNLSLGEREVSEWVEAQIVRLISAKEWGVTTEF